MGQPKGLLPLGDQPVVVRHLVGLSAVCEHLVVVLGGDEHAYRPVLPARTLVVVNPEWASTHPSDSLRLAVTRLDIDQEALVTPVDVLPPRRSTLEALVEGAAPCVPCGPTGQRGHPVRLGPSALRRLAAAPLAGGLRELLTDARDVVVRDAFVEGDFDDPGAWREARARWDRGSEGDTGGGIG